MAVTCTKELSEKIFTMTLLFIVNVLNYMDRYTIAGLLPELQKEFKVFDDLTGLLQTLFTLCYTISCPLCGYVGDRFPRRTLLCIGVFIWCSSNMLSSFMKTYATFATCRCVVSFGQALYSTISPTIIADLFVKRTRSIMFGIFFCATPIGVGAGYVLGTTLFKYTNQWHWSMRVTPFVGALCIILMCFMQEPKRGQSEGKSNLKITSYREDLRYLSRNVSYILTVFGCTTVSFVIGGLTWWGPTTFHLGINSPYEKEKYTTNEISLILGAITVVCGILGVLQGSFLSQFLITYVSYIDPIICGLNLVISFPMIEATFFTIECCPTITFVLLTCGELLVNANLAVLADVIFYVVVPTRRSTASAMQMFILHAFGDSVSPYLVGFLSEYFKTYFKRTQAYDRKKKFSHQYQGLKYALFSTNFIALIGGMCFFATAFHIDRDRRRAEAIQRETLAAQRETLAAQRETLAAQRETLAAQRETLAAQRDTLSSQ